MMIPVNVLIITATLTITYACYPGIKSIGTVSPMGDLDLLEGSDLIINCTLNKDYSGEATSKDIRWKSDRSTVDTKYIIVIDNRTAQLRINNVTVEDSAFYSCYAAVKNNPTLCNNFVSVGYAPAKDVNISCLSQNWENLTCTWKLPYNPVQTNWSFFFRTPKIKPECPQYINGHTGCFYSEHTIPPYRQAAEYFYFVLEGQNKFGYSKTNYKFNHYEQVLPAPPSELVITEIDPRKLFVKWKCPAGMTLFPPNLYYRLNYKSSWDRNWTEVDVGLNITNSTLSGLVPNTIYTIRVYARSGASKESPWSQEATAQKNTPKTVPDGVVNTTANGFVQKNMNDDRELTIYWQALPKIHWNGNNVTYVIDALEDGLQRNLVVSYHGNNSAVIKNLEKEKSYIFRIVAWNEIGPARQTALLTVGRASQVPSPPDFIGVIAFSDKMYEVSWQWPNSTSEQIDNYTVVWCDAQLPGRIQHCHGNFSWITVQSEERSINLTFPRVSSYQFAVGANFKMGTSGLTWASCTRSFNGAVGKMTRIEVRSIRSQEVTLDWRLDCSERVGVLQGFFIYYCEFDNNTQTCLGNETSVFVADPHASEFTLHNLKAFTNYKILLSAKTRLEEGERSDPRFAITKEAAPEDMCILGVTSISNNSILLSVQPPTIPNGKIKAYKFYINSNQWQSVINQTGNEFLIKDLKPYTNYSIQVEACTGKGELCSPRSIPLQETTEIGIPSPPEITKINAANNTHMQIDWEEPLNPNGPLLKWVVTFSWIDDESGIGKSQQTFFEADSNQIGKSQSRFVELPLPCNDKEEKRLNLPDYNVTIHAQTEMIDGMKSRPFPFSCAFKGVQGYPSWILVILCLVGVIIIFSLVGFFAFGLQRIKRKIQEIRNIKVELPKRLDAANIPPPMGYSDFKSQLGLSSIQTIRPLLYGPGDLTESAEFKGGENDPRFSTSSVDELIFNTKLITAEKNRRNLSGDSSGCSSCGHESVSSSLTNRTHLSVDSGTEMDTPIPASPDSVFSEPQWKNVPLTKTKCPSLPKVDETSSVNEEHSTYAQVAFTRCPDNDDYLTPINVSECGYSKLGSSSSSLTPPNEKLKLIIPACKVTCNQKPRLPTPPETPLAEFYSCVGRYTGEKSLGDCGYVPIDTLKGETSTKIDVYITNPKICSADETLDQYSYPKTQL